MVLELTWLGITLKSCLLPQLTTVITDTTNTTDMVIMVITLLKQALITIMAIKKKRITEVPDANSLYLSLIHI